MRAASTATVVAVAWFLGGCAKDVAGGGFGQAGPGATAAPDPDDDDGDGDGDDGDGSTGVDAEPGASDDTSGAVDDDDGASDGAEGDGDDGADDAGSSSSPDGGDAGDSGGAASYEYGRCSDGCPADQCITIDGFDGSFCTTACVDGSCPPPPDGEATGQCLLGPDLMMPPVNCVLTCSVAAQGCPGQMVCVDAMMGGDAGICLWQ